MIVCEQIIRDEHTKKISLIGSFNRIVCSKFPAQVRNCAIYVALTDGQGSYAGELRFSFAAGDQAVLGAKGTFKFEHPLQVVEMNFPIRRVPLPQPGKYVIEFFADGELLISRSFVASEKQEETTDAAD